MAVAAGLLVRIVTKLVRSSGRLPPVETFLSEVVPVVPVVPLVPPVHYLPSKLFDLLRLSLVTSRSAARVGFGASRNFFGAPLVEW